MEAMRRPDQQTSGAVLRLARGAKGGWEAQISQAGTYELRTADGKVKQFNIAAVPEPMTINGPWEVRFTPGWGAPEKAAFDPLEDWTARAEEGIRHYSGKATYRQTFTLPEHSSPNLRPQMILDLGEVRDLATVRVNGRMLATLWLAPWRVDITDSVNPGRNTLEIEVVNVWNNRLVGDAALAEAQRKTFILASTVKKNGPLLPAGLLGPVTLRTIQTVELK
jgi:hypothetical protein